STIAATYFPAFTKGTASDIANQIVTPAYSIAASNGAISSVVNDNTTTTDPYDGGAILEVLGGTLVAGANPTTIRVETLEILSVEIDNPGANYLPPHAITNITNANPGVVTSAAHGLV